MTAVRLPFLLVFAATAAIGQTRDARWLADLEALRAFILATHPDPFTRTPREVFERRVEDVGVKIPALSDAQVAVELAGLIATLNDGHSTFDLTQPGAGVRRYPLAIRWFSDGLFVTAAPERAARLIGAKVVSINGHSAGEAYEAVRPWLSYDTEGWARYQSETALATHEILAAAGIVALDSALTIEAETPGGERFTVAIPLEAGPLVAGPVAARSAIALSRTATGQDYWTVTGTWANFGSSGLERTAPRLDYWFEWLEDERALYIRYSRCRENVLLPVPAFVDEIVAFLNGRRAEAWVIDLRDNGGGNEAVFQQLYRLLTGRMPPPQRGVYGIINKRTFSSGVLAASLMKANGAAMIGEATGGRVAWFGNLRELVLPNSRLSVWVSTRRVGDPATAPEAVTPHETVEFNGADYFRFKDPNLERALSGRINSR